MNIRLRIFLKKVARDFKNVNSFVYFYLSKIISINLIIVNSHYETVFFVNNTIQGVTGLFPLGLPNCGTASHKTLGLQHLSAFLKLN